MNRNAFEAFPPRCFAEPVVKLSGLLTPLVIACGRESIRHVLLDHHRDYARISIRKRLLGPALGRGVLVAEGEAWKTRRQAMAAGFQPARMAIVAVHIARALDRACATLDQQAGRTVNAFDFYQDLSLRIAAKAIFSLDIRPLSTQMRSMLNMYISHLGRPSLADFMLPSWIPTPEHFKRAAFRRRWRGLIDEALAARRQLPALNRGSDLYHMLSCTHGDDQDLLADEVSTILIAGHETTALTMFWSTLLLAQCPEWRARLAAEAVMVDWDGLAQGTAPVPELPLATAIVRETLRLYSPAFLTARCAKRTHAICGIDVPAGSTVLIPLWMLHRNEAYWPAPDTFDPTRFLNNPHPPRFEYLPFGVDSHVCIGAQLAMLEATLTLSRLSRDYSPVMLTDRPVLPVGVLSTRPDHTPGIRFTRANRMC